MVPLIVWGRPEIQTWSWKSRRALKYDLIRLIPFIRSAVSLAAAAPPPRCNSLAGSLTYIRFCFWSRHFLPMSLSRWEAEVELSLSIRLVAND